MIYFSPKKLFRIKWAELLLCSVFSLCLTFTLRPISSYAQNVSPGYTVKHWGTEDGLPVNEISRIWKTSDGYMWLRSSEGIIRFDGKTFTQFNNANNTAFTSSSSDHLAEKGINQFWFNNGRNGNIRLVRYKNGSFTHFPFHLNQISPEIILHLHFDLSPDGKLWLATDDGLYIFENEAFFKAYEDVITEPVRGVVTVGNSILVAVKRGFYLIKEKGISFTEHDNTNLLHFTLDKSEIIWLATEREVRSIKEGKIQTYELPLSPHIPQIVDIRVVGIQNNLSTPELLLFSNFVTAYAYENRQYKLLYTENDVRESNIPLLTELSLKDNKGWVKTGNVLWYNNERVTTTISPEFGAFVTGRLFVDEHGSAWIGSSNGLYQYDKSIFTSYGNKEGIDNVYPLFQDHTGSIWTSSMGGILSRIENEQVERLTEHRTFPRVLSFYEDSAHNIWLGTSTGLQLWNRQLESFSSVEVPFNGQGVRVSVVRENEDGNLWIGSRRGLYEYNRGDRTWKRVPDENGSDIRIAQMHTTNNGDIWVGSDNNALFFLKDDTLHAFKDNELLSGVNIRSIYSDEEGILWVGFQGGGLNRIKLAKDGLSAESVTKYNPDNGLFGSVIHTILEDDYNRFWMSSNQGIFWIDKAQLNEFAAGTIDRISPVIYQVEDGLPGNEANGAAQNSGLIAKDGSFWFAMRHGVTNIHPDSVQALTLAFPAHIESISCGDSVRSVPDAQFTLPKESRNISIKYTAFNYRVKSENISFSYILEGLQNEWVYAGTNRDVSFTNLSAGEYTFRVRAGMNGQWDDTQMESVSFSIEPYFYETSWFKGILIALGSSILIGLIFWGNRKLQFQRDQYELEVKEQEEVISENEEFLKKLQEFIEERITQPTITALELSSAMNMSERQLYRMVKTITGFTPQQFVREVRLKKAQQILETRQAGTIAEVAYSVGFSTPFYFSKIFTERFDLHPNELLK